MGYRQQGNFRSCQKLAFYYTNRYYSTYLYGVAIYSTHTNISEAIKPNDPDGSFLFLKLFTVSDGTLPSFVLFINFLGPLLGIALGFDAVNSEQNKGTLSRMLSQPIHRDCIINAKFVAALIVIGIMLFVLGFSGDGMWADCYWYSSYGRRVLENCFLHHYQYLLCSILVESGYSVSHSVSVRQRLLP